MSTSSSSQKRLVVLAFPVVAGLWLAPTALADPPDQTRHVAASDGSTFNVTYHHPPNAEGIASSFEIVPDGGQIPPPEGAKRFVYHEVLITNSSGVVLQQGDAANSVGHKHPLVTITYQGVDISGDTIQRTGFYLPAKPPK